MKMENGKIVGDIQIAEDFQLNGTVTGSVTVSPNAHFQLQGMVLKNLVIEAGGSAEINGTVQGYVTNSGSLVVRGVIKGLLSTLSGTTETTASARISSQA
ncbi:hypothetical protein PMM47T1_24014 [Pseudomonas sp. M47T1]|uniref:polymer-forming cytoskeletal protein n=1 Tax=Pseudomonas sp. M47T1 TaxID=1179778 RepID=UPI00026068F5|nr:polymer-forming cytoskeletal protein [Pseudomonas sp. M47T1]EIK94015.1 hypothetical protein PMM47T1_24014 [Pseudomonas sp. M47T1]